MHRSKHLLLLGSILLAASLLLALIPVTSTAFAATTGTQSASRASMLAHLASSRLVPDACPPTCSNPINVCPPGQSENASTNNPIWVEVIQFRLNDLSREHEPHLGILSVDGSFGPNTEAEVAQFQQDENIQGGGGAVGDRTWSALGFCPGNTATFGISGTTSRTNCPPSQSNGGSGNDTNFVQ
ncbi:MAG TPA: peptidoglycan-binding domain-containing protein, partial [Ktedonobacteraceae bacterium]|nr:peptidoglycan-binding domain-containing protein [Ktedonobacteraceae bacterium]